MREKLRHFHLHWGKTNSESWNTRWYLHHFLNGTLYQTNVYGMLSVGTKKKKRRIRRSISGAKQNKYITGTFIMVKFSAFGTSHIQRLFLFYFKLHWLIYTLIFSETCQPAKCTCFNINVNSQTPVDSVLRMFWSLLRVRPQKCPTSSSEKSSAGKTD